MAHLRNILIAVLILLTTTISFAENDGDGGGNDNKKQYDVLSKDAERILTLLNNFATDPGPDEAYVLKAFNNPDVIDVAIRRLDLELKSSRNNRPLISVLIFIVLKYAQYPEYDKTVILDRQDVLRNMGANLRKAYDADPMMRGPIAAFGQVLEEVKGIQEKFAKDSIDKVNEALKNKKLRQNPGELLVVPTDEKETFVSPAERLHKFVKHLDYYLVGQPEVKEALYDLEFEAMIKGAGNVKEPPFFMLMGLPGNGKDTAVETYIDAVWGRRGAYREHMFRVEVQRSQADAWSLLGSAKGYIGSETLPEFVHFLVKHSGGKYLIKKTGGNGKEYEVVEVHPGWKPGEVLPNYFPPEKAAVFLNEFHDWSAEAKSLILKQFLEKGIIKISGSGGGLTQLEIPGIRIFAATNEGIGLLANRDSEGLRFGSPLEYDQMMVRHKTNASNKDLLKQELARTALKNPAGTPKDQQLGTPEEIRNRTHPSRMLLLEPLSPTQLRQIIRNNIEFLNEQYVDAERGAFGSFEIKTTDRLVEFIQKYDYVAEDNARPIKDKIRALLEYPFNQGLKNGNFTPDMVKDGITLDVQLNPDKTSSLIIMRGIENSTEVLWKQPIRYTYKERASEPITNEKIDHLAGLEERLKDRLFGQPRAVKLVSEAALLSEEVRHADKKGWNDHEKATSFAFLGPSSTGKSELAKAVVNEIYPEYGEERRIDIDFNKIQSEEDLREFIWGRKMGRDVQSSEFMRKYDQFNGDILFVFEESTNTPRRLLMSLYDLFREKHPKFADGKDRPMTRVTIIMTGNAGIKWYSQIPKNVPLKVQIAAWRMVYEAAMKNPEHQRATLEEYMPEPLINRIGQSNIVWFAPLDFQAIRELTILKLANNLEKLKPGPGRRGWDVGFRNDQEKMKIVELVEKEGFYLHEQGASVDRYAEDQIQKGLRSLLLKNKIESGSRVVLVPRNDQTDEVVGKQEHVKIDVLVEGQAQPLVLEAYAQTRAREPESSRVDQILTAAHEAGHELVRRTLLGDKYQAKFITVIPGVTQIGGKWIYYAGLASSERKQMFDINREAAIREIAVLMGGFLGEQAASIGERHGQGKSNDIERATALATAMVTKWGMESEWGFGSEDPSQMSEERRQLKEKLVKKILDEGVEMAKRAIEVNSALHIELSRQLALQGKLKSDAINEVYDKMSVRDVSDWTNSMRRQSAAEANQNHNSKLIAELDLPQVANIDDIIDRDRLEQIAKARTPKQLPVFTDFAQMDLIDRLAQAVNGGKPREIASEEKGRKVVLPTADQVACKAYFAGH